MMIDNKYNAVPLDTLIKSVQAAVKILTSRKRSAKSSIRKSADIYQMQASIQNRLSSLDRLSVNFFPLESYVCYQRSVAMKFFCEMGYVKGRSIEENVVLVAFDKEPEKIIKIAPRYLKLMYIR